MSKAVMISIQPKWVELIARGKKTLEVRKTRPKLQLPFKCYIYCTKAQKPAVVALQHLEDSPYVMTVGYSGKNNQAEDSDWARLLNGMVVGEFLCADIIDVWPGYKEGDDCLTFEQQEKYLGSNGHGYGWKISDLKIYDNPKKLDEFYRWYEDGDDIRPCQNGRICVHIIYDYSEDCEACDIDFDGTACPYLKVQRPPQSWCYVEELEDWK